jgi:hypothetical protein
MKIFFAIVFLYAIGINAKSQDRISTDRPDQTESAWLTPKKFFQAEFGLGLIDIDPENAVLTLPDMLLKYGLAKHFEVQVAAQYISYFQKTAQSTKDTWGLTAIELGFRVGLWEQKKIIPKTSVIVRAGLPFLSSETFRTDHVPTLILLTMENSITEHFGLSYNLGAAWDGDDPKPSWLYSLSAGFDIAKRWDGFVEVFGALPEQNSPLNSIDTGIGFYINDNMKLDAYFGLRVSKAADRNFFGVGYSFRINTKRK